jgi:transcriptional regulator with XRE-family HTH domain
MPCLDAAVAYQRNLRRQKAYGRFQSRFVPVDRARVRIQEYRALGLSYKQIAKMCGVSEPTVHSTIEGYAKKRNLQQKALIHKDSEEKIMNAKLDLSALNPRSFISTRGFIRRFQALARLGYRAPGIATRMGIDDSNLRHMLEHDKISVAHFRSMMKIYSELFDRPATASRGYDKGWIERQKREALAKGWAHPFDWGNIDFDEFPDLDVPA